MTALPPLPKRKNGVYDPADVLRYLEDAAQFRLSHEQMSKHLNVPLHRVIYLMNDGQTQLAKRKDREVAKYRNRAFATLDEREMRDFIMFMGHGYSENAALRATLYETFLRERKSVKKTGA